MWAPLERVLCPGNDSILSSIHLESNPTDYFFDVTPIIIIFFPHHASFIIGFLMNCRFYRKFICDRIIYFLISRSIVSVGQFKKYLKYKFYQINIKN